MLLRELGSTGLRVSELGLGCSRVGLSSFADGRAEGRRLLETALDLGITLFDTADVYGFGTSETLLGEVLAGRRDRVVLATKVGKSASALARAGRRVGPTLGPARQLLRRLRAPLRRLAPSKQAFDPSSMRRALEGSLVRLQTDRVDLYQLHSPNPEVLARDEVFETLERFKAEGKIRFWGISLARVEDGFLFTRGGARADLPVSALQLPFHALSAEPTHALLRAAGVCGLGIIAREPLAGGRLAADPVRALRFVLDEEAVSAAIPGTGSVRHLLENAQATKRP